MSASTWVEVHMLEHIVGVVFLCRTLKLTDGGRPSLSGAKVIDTHGHVLLLIFDLPTLSLHTISNVIYPIHILDHF